MYQPDSGHTETHPAWLPTIAELESVTDARAADCFDPGNPQDAEVAEWIADANAAAAELAGELAIR